VLEPPVGASERVGKVDLLRELELPISEGIVTLRPKEAAYKSARDTYGTRAW
jgi:hypothetical protein